MGAEFGRLQESLVKYSQMFWCKRPGNARNKEQMKVVSDILQSTEVKTKKANEIIDMKSLWKDNNHRVLLY